MRATESNPTAAGAETPRETSPANRPDGRRRMVAGVSVITLAILLYLEPARVAGLKFAEIWKVAAITLLWAMVAFQLVRTAPVVSRSAILAISTIGLLVLIPLIHSVAQGATGPEHQVVLRRASVLLALAAIALLRPGRDALVLIVEVSIWTCALSAIPFFLGIVEPLGTRYDTTAISPDSVFSFVGVFQFPHTASIACAIAAVAALSTALASTGRRRVLYMLAFAWLSSLVVLTFARAGLLGWAVGVLFLLSRHSQRLSMVVVISVSLGLGGWLATQVVTGNLLKARIEGYNRFAGTSSLNEASSGRLGFWAETFEAYSLASIGEQLMGISDARVREVVARRSGSPLIAHNAMLHELAANGAVGLAALVTLFLTALRASLRLAAPERETAVAMLFCFGAFGFVQSIDYPLLLLLVLLPCVVRRSDPLSA